MTTTKLEAALDEHGPVNDTRTDSRVLIFDGDCEFCRRQVTLIKRWDVHSRIEALPFQRADLERYGVSRSAAEEAMQVVTPSGEVFHGAEAAREILRTLPLGRPFAWAFRLPGVTRVAEVAYRWIAKRRHRFACDSAACRRDAS